MSSPQHTLQSSYVQQPTNIVYTTQPTYYTVPTQQVQTVREVIVTQQDNKEWETIQKSLMQEIEAYKNKCIHMEQHVVSLQQEVDKAKLLETKLNAVFEENIKLHTLLNDQNSDKQKLKAQIDEMMLQASKLKVFEAEVNKLQDIVQIKNKEVESCRQKTTNYEIELQQLRISEAEKHSSIDDLNKQVDHHKLMHMDHMKRNDDIVKNLKTQHELEATDLKQHISNKQQDNESWRNKYFEGQQEYNTLATQHRSHEDKIIMLTQEVQRLNNFLETKGQEVELLHKRSTEQEQMIIQLQGYEAEVRRLKDVQQMKQQENAQLQQKITVHSSTIDGLKLEANKVKDHEAKIGLLSNEIGRLQDINSNKVNEIEDWKKKHQDKDNHISSLKLTEAEKEQLENKYALLAQENQRLNDNINQKITNHNNLQIQHNQLEQEYNRASQWEIEHKKLSDHFKIKENHLKDLQDKHYNLEQEHLQVKGIADTVPHLNQQIDGHIKDLHSHKQAISDHVNDIDNHKGNINQLEQQVATLKIYEGESQRLKNHIDHKELEVNDWKNRHQQSEIQLQHRNKRIDEHENKHNLLQAEIERLQNLVTARSQQLESTTKQNNQLEETIFQLRKKEQLCSEYESKLILLTQEIERLGGVIQQKSQELEQARIAKADLDNVLQQHLQQQTKLEQNNRMLNNEVDRLQKEDEQNRNELADWRYKYAQYSTLTSKIEYQWQLLVLCFAIIESLQNRVNDKEREVEDVRRSSLMFTKSNNNKF